ncbi:GerMN domain-containing protein [Pleurocapsales cyanobacterium LEGE 10410]|nr:GerMN domain-containing protein [Pleurocapsales cyanobacterium LEGE 10410]
MTMKTHNKLHDKSPTITPILIGLSFLLIGAAELAGIWSLSRIILPTVTKSGSSSVEEVQPAKFAPQMYQLEIVDRLIRLTPKTIYTSATSPKVALTEALGKLFAQAIAFDPTTTIPQGTRLLDLQNSEDGIHIDLSQEFTQGGGSSSMIYRVAQVLYTATSIDPQARVFLSVEGQPLNEDYPLGGEGLALDYPLTRKVFDREFLAD